MSLISTADIPDYRHLLLYDVLQMPEKWAEVKMTGLLQLTNSKCAAPSYLIVGIPTALVRGVFDAMHEPGISLPGFCRRRGYACRHCGYDSRRIETNRWF